jgi:hypothetical protein
MAAVTLKDLMDPLTKIQAATESTAQSIDQLTMAVTASGQVGDGIQSAILAELQLQTELLRQQSRGGGGISALFGGSGGGGGNAEGLESGGNALRALGAGATDMAKALLLFMLVPKGTITKFNNFVLSMVESLGNMDTGKVDKGAAVLGELGSSILSFVKALALSALLLIPAAIGIPLLYITVGLTAPLFMLLGMGEKQIQKGINALDGIGDALKSFALGLAGFALVTFFILMQPTILLGMVASLVLIGGAVALLGLVEKQVDKGSGALALMGLALGVFGLGYALFALTFAATAPTMEAIGMQFLLLAGMGVVFALAGSFMSMIAQGALSFALTGIGLVVFGLGYNPFAKAVKGTTMEDVGIQLALLTGLGLVMAGAGALVAATAGLILLGPVMYAAVGGALLVLAPGLEAIKKVNFTEDDSLKLATMLAGVKTAFIGPPNEGGVSGFFKSIGGAISGAVDSVKMISAAAGFAAAGVALSKLSVGLKDYQKLDWTDSDSLRLTGVLSGITTAFAQAGGEAATPTGLFGAVFGNAFSPNATKKGIDSVMGAGKALTSIAEGLTAFSALVDKDVDFEYIGKQIELTVGFIQRAFAAVAEEGNVEAGGFFNSLFGIKKNKVKEGLDSVKGAGKSLNDIANGLTAFQALVEKDIDFNKVGKAISKSVGFVQEAFSAVAEEGNVQAGGFWNSLFKIKKNKVQEGIKSVKGAGAELKQIADGLATFSGIEDPEGVAKKIKVVVGMVGNAFAAVGGMEQEDSGFFGLIKWDENLVEKGIDAVDGAGSALIDIANGLNAFNKSDMDPIAVSASISALLTSIGQTFADLYTTNPFISMQLDDFAEFIVTIGDVAEKGQLDKAADGISKIADAVNKIEIDKAVAFGDLFKSSSQLSSDRGAYRALAKAVQDIRDIMVADTGGGAEGGEGEGGGVRERVKKFFNPGDKGSSKTDKRLMSTLSSLDRAITNLPGNIASIELEVVQR